MSEHEPIETDVRDSNPNAAGPARLAGDMGISSERTGPEGDEPADAGLQGTGSHGSAARSTDGLSSTGRQDGPEMDDTQQEATQSWRDEQPAASPEGAGPSPASGVDRTVGEPHPADVPGQDLDPGKNPGHSHG